MFGTMQLFSFDETFSRGCQEEISYCFSALCDFCFYLAKGFKNYLQTMFFDISGWKKWLSCLMRIPSDIFRHCEFGTVFATMFLSVLEELCFLNLEQRGAELTRSRFFFLGNIVDLFPMVRLMLVINLNLANVPNLAHLVSANS